MEDTVSTTTTTYCTRHPKVETGLACASCGTPICPKCMVVTPVGMKCPDCGHGANSALYQVRADRLILAGIVALLGGAVAALVGELGFLVIFLSLPCGYFAGDMILRASGMKRGRKLEILAGAGMVLGALGLKLLPTILFGKIGVGILSLTDVFFWVALVISTGAALSKIRYL